MSRDEYFKLFTYMNQRFDAIDQRFELAFTSLDGRLDSVYGLLDSYMKRREDYEDELAATGSQLNRHDRWIHQLADKTKTNLT